MYFITTKYHGLPGGLVKNLPAMQQTRVQSLGQEVTLEKEIANYSSILAWRIPRTEEPDELEVHEVSELDTNECLTLSLSNVIKAMASATPGDKEDKLSLSMFRSLLFMTYNYNIEKLYKVNWINDQRRHLKCNRHIYSPEDFNIHLLDTQHV